MKPQIKAFIAGGALALALFGTAMAGPLEDGWAAYLNADYATAMRVWRPLADQGNADAQYGLAVLYSHGYGVAEDDAEAEKWYRKAAEQGDSAAQLTLGGM